MQQIRRIYTSFRFTMLSQLYAHLKLRNIKQSIEIPQATGRV